MNKFREEEEKEEVGFFRQHSFLPDGLMMASKVCILFHDADDARKRISVAQHTAHALNSLAYIVGTCTSMY
jgi:hypothetical protein